MKDRGVSVAQASRDLDVHENVLRKWVRQQAADPQHSFPGHGQMKPEQQEIERLRREVTKLKAERDILKRMARPVRKGEVRMARSVCINVSGLGATPGQDGDPRILGLIKATALNAAFRTRLPGCGKDLQAICSSPPTDLAGGRQLRAARS